MLENASSPPLGAEQHAAGGGVAGPHSLGFAPDSHLKALFVALLLGGAAADLEHRLRPNERLATLLAARAEELDRWAWWSFDALDELVESPDSNIEAMVVDGGQIDRVTEVIDAWASMGDVPLGLRGRLRDYARDIKREARRMHGRAFFESVARACHRQVVAFAPDAFPLETRGGRAWMTRRPEEFREGGPQGLVSPDLGTESDRWIASKSAAGTAAAIRAWGALDPEGHVEAATPTPGADDGALPPLQLEPFPDTRAAARGIPPISPDMVPRHLARAVALEGETVLVIFDDGRVFEGKVTVDRRHTPAAVVLDSGTAVWIIDLTRVREIRPLVGRGAGFDVPSTEPNAEDASWESIDVGWDGTESSGIPIRGDFIEVRHPRRGTLRGWVTWVDEGAVVIACPYPGELRFLQTWQVKYRDERGLSLFKVVPPNDDELQVLQRDQGIGIGLVSVGALLVVGGVIAAPFTFGIGSIPITPGIALMIIGAVKLARAGSAMGPR
jgi:hypothetical protein